MHTRYTVSGQGPELVLIHGVGLDLTMWERAQTGLPPESFAVPPQP